MRAFVAVATLGSFVEAARRLRMSPSAITRAVAQLEDQLGSTLLSRTTRSLRLTERGELYLESSRRILEDINDAERRARGQDTEPLGLLTVAAPIVFGRLHAMPIVTGLLLQYRALSVRLTLSDRNVQLIEEGVDVAIRIGDLADSSLISSRLGEVGRILVASPDYIEARGRPAAPEALADHDIIAFEGVDTGGVWRFGAEAKGIKVAPRLVVNSADAANAAAEAGLGIARALSYQVREAVEAGRLVPLMRPFEPAPAPVSAVSPPRRAAAANVAAFIRAAREHVKANPLGLAA